MNCKNLLLTSFLLVQITPVCAMWNEADEGFTANCTSQHHQAVHATLEPNINENEPRGLSGCREVDCKITNHPDLTQQDLKNLRLVNRTMKKLRDENTLHMNVKDIPNLSIEYFQSLINLTYVNLSRNAYITNDSVKALTNLRILDLSWNNNITNRSVKRFTKLTTLSLHQNCKILDWSVKRLTNLTKLDLSYNKNITDDSIKYLTKLTTLSLHENYKITDASVKILTSLTYLELGRNKNITEDSIKHLTSLTTLDLIANYKITNRSVKRLTKHLTNLTNLEGSLFYNTL